MGRSGLVVGIVLTVAHVGAGQTPPKGGDKYFGAPLDQKFDADAIFAKPIPKPAPRVPSVVPDGVAPDDGWVQSNVLTPAIWAGSADLGVNGATGNSDLLNLRTNWNVVRKAPDHVLTADFLYQLTKQDGVTRTNQALFNARDELPFLGTPWSTFASTNIEYDELRQYDFRAGVYGGVGYTVVDEREVTFKLRAGAGVVREFVVDGLFGDPVPGERPLKNRWVAEFVFGHDLRYAINDRSAFFSVFDYYPRIDDFTQFRLRARAGYEYIFDPERGIILRAGVQDRYDSKPGLSERNDLTYFVSLGLKF